MSPINFLGMSLLEEMKDKAQDERLLYEGMDKYMLSKVIKTIPLINVICYNTTLPDFRSFTR